MTRVKYQASPQIHKLIKILRRKVQEVSSIIFNRIRDLWISSKVQTCLSVDKKHKSSTKTHQEHKIKLD